MTRKLVAIRLRAFLSGMLRQGRKKRGKGMVVLFALLYLYLIAVFAGMMCFTFYQLAEPYHAAGLDWLYFAMAGLMGLGFALIGSVFATQNQLYDAKDNELLLSMPVTPRAILISRILPLLALNLLFSGVVIIPAAVMFAIFAEFSFVGLLCQLLALLAVSVFAQALACFFGWLLHLLLGRMNKSFASLLFMLLFLGVYFYVYSQAGRILRAIAENGESLAETLQTWVWPLYAMGRGCLGDGLHLLAFVIIAAALFGLVYWILSKTFLKTVTAKYTARRKRKLDVSQSRQTSPLQAVVGKEWHKFLGSPVYLTNMGLGAILTAVLPIAGIFVRNTVMEYLVLLDFLRPWVPILIWAMLSFTATTACISTPSVSLEGKNIWIMKSMPISSRDILLGKLRLHCRLTVPVSVLAALVLTVAYGCSGPEILLVTISAGLFPLFVGLLGMWAGLQWAKLDYINEAYPCKQSASVAVAMFGSMGVPTVLGLVYVFLLSENLSPMVFLGIYDLLLMAASYGFYRVLLTWGVRKWESL